MSRELVDIEIAILILRYGRSRVLRAIAGLQEQSVEEIEQRVQALARKAEKPKRSKPSLIGLAEIQVAERPGSGDLLRLLVTRFESRTFLPQLRDVERFLEKIGAPHRKLRSRAAAGPLLVHALGRLSPDELAKLASEDTSDGGEYEMLAHAIMASSLPRAPKPGKGR